MPLFAVNLSDKLFTAIKELVEDGKYASFESFLEIASFNQLALERGSSPQDIVDRGHRHVRGQESRSADDGASPKGKAERPASRKKPGRNGETRKAAISVARNGSDSDALSPADYDAAFDRLALATWPENGLKPGRLEPGTLATQRLFGQVNRLLPLKLACRWLAKSSAADRKWPKYDAISDRLADDAATIGSLLEKWDMESGRKRDELLATGLPRRGNSASRDRFLSQFVARLTRGGDIYPGAICLYQLAKFEESTLVLTEQGLGFAQIDSPVLDAKNKKTPTALSEDETNYLVQQVLSWVPTERDDMRIVLKAVQEGRTTPSELTAAVQSEFPRDWTESVALTHISGLVARLAELRLLRRQWQGRRVTYELGNKVDQFLKVTSTEDRHE